MRTSIFRARHARIPLLWKPRVAATLAGGCGRGPRKGTALLVVEVGAGWFTGETATLDPVVLQPNTDMRQFSVPADVVMVVRPE